MPLDLKKTFGKYVYPIPLPSGEKFPPPTGSTGRNQSVRYRWSDLKGSNPGGVVKEGFVVIDEDKAHPEFDKLPPTLTVTTGGGGRQFYYRFKLKEGQSFKSEIRIDGSKHGDVRHNALAYVILPGAKSAKGKYTLSDDSPVAELPKEFHWMVLHEGRTAKIAYPQSSQAVKQPFLSPISKIGEGSRNQTLYNYGRDLWDTPDYETTEQIEEELAKKNERLCEPPLEDSAIRAMARSVTNNAKPFLVDSVDGSLWQMTPALRHIYATAIANHANPIAVLTYLLARLSAVSVGVGVRSPMMSGGFRSMPLHLWTASVGSSGSGKSQGASVAREFLPVPLRELSVKKKALGIKPLVIAEPRSKEGLYDCFLYITKEDRKNVLNPVKKACVLVELDEVGDSLAYYKKQQPETFSILKSSFFGETIVSSVSKKTTTGERPDIEAGSYSLGFAMRGTYDDYTGFFQHDTTGVRERTLFIDCTMSGQVREDIVESNTRFKPYGFSPCLKGLDEVVMSLEVENQAIDMEIDRIHEIPEASGHKRAIRIRTAALLALLERTSAKDRCTIEMPHWKASGILVHVAMPLANKRLREFGQNAEDARARSRGRSAAVSESAKESSEYGLWVDTQVKKLRDKFGEDAERKGLGRALGDSIFARARDKFAKTTAELKDDVFAKYQEAVDDQES